MLEGLEAPPAPPLDLAQAKDDLKKDMRNFFSQDHDFSITLIAKKKPEVPPPLPKKTEAAPSVDKPTSPAKEVPEENIADEEPQTNAKETGKTAKKTEAKHDT